MLPALVIAASLCIVPQTPVIEERVAAVELNHFYDESGSHVFDQWLFWDEDGLLIDWRMVKRPGNRSSDGALLLFDPMSGPLLRKIRAPSRMETWTQYDRELEHRQVLPKEFRRGLSARP